MWRDLSKAVRELRWALGGESCGTYRPDLHYMRGPGPKWHAKYGSLVAKTSPTDLPTSLPAGATLRDVAEHHA